jgi:hypothetical protein
MVLVTSEGLDLIASTEPAVTPAADEIVTLDHGAEHVVGVIRYVDEF